MNKNKLKKIAKIVKKEKPHITYNKLKSDLKVKIIEYGETINYQFLLYYDLVLQRTKRNELKIIKTRYIIIN